MITAARLKERSVATACSEARGTSTPWLTGYGRACRAGRSTFKGEGARRHGGRWNHPGVPAVYTAAHRSLAVLELLVHVAAPEDLPADLVAVAADVPDDLRIEDVGTHELPRDWRRTPAPAALADRGTAWLRAARTAVLAVPSAVVPLETNYILNPAHPDFRRIVAGRAQPFGLDPRLGSVTGASIVIRVPPPRRRRRTR